MTLNIDSILFPTDFSDVAEGAFAHAAHLALQSHATIHVFNVVSPDEAPDTNPMDFLPVDPTQGGDSPSDAAVQHMDVKTATQERGTVPVIYTQRDSASPSEAIIDYATDRDMDVVVMGTHGRQGMERLLSGSVSEEVVRGAPCPVFTVLPSAEESGVPTISRVLAPVDLSEQSSMVVDHAAALSDAYGTPLDLLHVVEEAAYPSAYGLDTTSPTLPDVQDRAREALETLASELEMRTDPVNIHVLAGNAARDIVEFADKHEADLIVMATHGRTGLDRFLIGSVAEKVVRQAPCPVFTLKSFGKSLLPEG